MGPSMVAFIKEVYGRAKEVPHVGIASPEAHAMVASSFFWDMRLSIVCAATDAEYQNRIILHGNSQYTCRGEAAPSRPQLRRRVWRLED